MITIRISIFIFIITIFRIYGSFIEFFLDDYWSADSMAKRDGYAVEVHKVTTEDGYILTVHRIPGDEGAQSILLMHGLLCNSALWLVLGRGHSLGLIIVLSYNELVEITAFTYLLADEGYDVWLGNVRGNSYGLNHVNLTANDSEFWDFTYDEMGMYDLPATIDYIQNSTNQYPFYIGHSQGTTMSFILANERPDIANLLKPPISLAPVAYKASVWNSYMRLLIPIIAGIFRIIQSFTNLQTFFTPSWWPIYFLKFFCAVLSLENYNCLNVIPDILGYERPELFNQTLLPAILTNFPAGTSLKNMFLYAQAVQFQRFAKYDYGEAKNLEIYNSSIPSEYDLINVIQPNAIFVADSDVFVQFPDLNKILQLVPNIVDQYVVNASGFTHMDFVWGSKAKDVVYDQVIELVNKYNNL